MMMQPGSAETTNTPPHQPHHRRHRYQETEDDTRGSWQPESPTRRDDGRLMKIQLDGDDSGRQENSTKQESSKKTKGKKKKKANKKDAGRTTPAAKCKRTTTSSPTEGASEASRKQAMPKEILNSDEGAHPTLESGTDVVPTTTSSKKRTTKKKKPKKKVATQKSQEENIDTHGKKGSKMLDSQSNLGSEKNAKLAPQEKPMVSAESMAPEQQRKATKKTTAKKRKTTRSQKVAKVDSSVLLVAPVGDIVCRATTGNENLDTSHTATVTSSGIVDFPRKSKEEKTMKTAKIKNAAASSMKTIRDQRKEPKKNTHRRIRAQPLYISSDDDDDDDDEEDDEDRPGAIHVGDSTDREGYSENVRNDNDALATIEEPTTSIVSNNPLVLEANLVVEEDEERILENYIRNKTVQATQVEGVEAAEQKKRIQRRRQFLGCSCLCMSSIAVVLGLSLGLAPNDIPTSAPTTTVAPSGVPTISVVPSSNPSDFPTYSRIELLHQTIGPDITHDTSILRNTSSNHYAALSWLATFDESDLIDELRESGSEIAHRRLIERYAVVLLYLEVVTIGLLSFDFFAILDTCDWFTSGVGVSCSDGELFIDRVLTEGLDLEGTMPTEIALLRGLKILDISNNRFTGTIPSIIGSLTNLVALNLTSNLLGGTVPSELGSLSHLRELLLDKNDLVGDLDALFCDAEASVSLDSFKADCAGEEPEVTCSCCTVCCDRSESCSN